MKSFVSIVKVFLFAAVCLALPGLASAQSMGLQGFLNGKLTITPLPPPTTRTTSSRSEGTTHGYVEYRFLVNNMSDQRHQVTFTFGGNNAYRGNLALSHASTSVIVEPKSEATATILQPPVPFWYAPLEVRIDNGRSESMSFSSTPHGVQRYGSRYGYSYRGSSGGMVANILVSNKITANQRELLTRGTLEEEKPPENAETAPGMGMGGVVMIGPGGTPSVDTHSVWQSQVPTDQWSDQWLSYTRFDCVVVNNDDLNVLKPDAFRALRRYVEMGGMFVVLDARSSQPTNWPKHWVETDEVPLPGGLTLYRAVQGDAYVLSGSVNEEAAIQHLRLVIMEVARRYNAIMGFAENDAEHFERIAPLGILYAIPVRSLVVLVIFFALLIGPVNMVVLGMFKRRVWLIWTIPLTSVVASCLVLGLVVFSEGVKRVTSVKSLTILDQRRGEAMTSGIVGFYRTFAPPGGLRFSNSTEVTPVIGNMDGLSLGLQTYGEQHLSQNWIRPRIPAFFLLRKAAPSNVRLVFDWHGEPTVTNGLGVKITALNVIAPDGKTYTLDLLEPGQKANLQLDPKKTVSEEHTYFQATLGFDTQLNRISLPTQGRGTYVATIDGDSPFLEPGIDNMRPHTRVNTIFGIFSADGMPEQ